MGRVAYPDKGRHGVRGATSRRSVQIRGLGHRGVRGPLWRGRVVRPWVRFLLFPGSCDGPQLTGRARCARSGRVAPRKEIAAGLAGAGTATLPRSRSPRWRAGDHRRGPTDRLRREREGLDAPCSAATEISGCNDGDLQSTVLSAHRLDAGRAEADRHRAGLAGDRPRPSGDGANFAAASPFAAGTERAGSRNARPSVALS
jgi:hypothetical protein